LARGVPAGEVLQGLVDADPGREVRQLGVVDREGRSRSWTGKDCVGWCGHEADKNFAAQGNMLTGEAVVAAFRERRLPLLVPLRPGALPTRERRSRAWMRA